MSTNWEPQKKYDKANTTGFYLKLNNKTDADIIARFAAVESKQGYIKRLIREDLARTGSGSCVSVPVSEQAKEYLEKAAQDKGVSVPDLIAAIMNEQIARTLLFEKMFKRQDEKIKEYRIKPEFIDLWGEDCTTETVVTEEQITSLARDWGKTVDELKEQVYPNTPAEVAWYTRT